MIGLVRVHAGELAGVCDATHEVKRNVVCASLLAGSSTADVNVEDELVNAHVEGK